MVALDSELVLQILVLVYLTESVAVLNQPDITTNAPPQYCRQHVIACEECVDSWHRSEYMDVIHS